MRQERVPAGLGSGQAARPSCVSWGALGSSGPVFGRGDAGGFAT